MHGIHHKHPSGSPVTSPAAKKRRIDLTVTSPPAASTRGVQGSKGKEVLVVAEEDDIGYKRRGLNEMPHLVKDNLFTKLLIKDIAHLAQVSKDCYYHVKEADEFAEKKLENIIKPKIDEMIKNSGITGIKMPEGPFHNSIHEMRALIAFKDALPNAINVLNDNNIRNINTQDICKNTPLHWAAIKGQKYIAKALIDAGANLNAQDIYKNTPLHRAAFKGQTEIAKALIAAKANVNAPNNIGLTPLHWAAGRSHTEIAKALIAARANVNAQDRWKKTPLHWAVQQGHTDIAKALIAAPRADVNVQDNRGRTPLHYAARNGHTDIAQYLIDVGADVNAPSNNGTTPLHWAETAGQTKVVEILRAAQNHTISMKGPEA